jgi:hypothetical protein
MLVGLSGTHLSPELVPFFLSSIQPQLAVDPLFLLFSFILEIFVSSEIDQLVRLVLCKGRGQVSATPSASTTPSPMSTPFPSFVVRATCGRPVLIL